MIRGFSSSILAMQFVVFAARKARTFLSNWGAVTIRQIHDEFMGTGNFRHFDHAAALCMGITQCNIGENSAFKQKTVLWDKTDLRT